MKGTIVGVAVPLEAAVALVSSHGHSVEVDEAVVVRVAGALELGAGLDEVGATEEEDDGGGAAEEEDDGGGAAEEELELELELLLQMAAVAARVSV